MPPELEEIVLKALSPERRRAVRDGPGARRPRSGGPSSSRARRSSSTRRRSRSPSSSSLAADRERAAAAARPRVSGEPARTQAAVPLARSLPGSRARRGADSVPPPRTGRNRRFRAAAPRPEGPREVRHVAVLMLRLQGLRRARAAAPHARPAPRHARRPRLQARDALGLGRRCQGPRHRGRRREPVARRGRRGAARARRPRGDRRLQGGPARRRSRPRSASSAASPPARATRTGTSSSTRCTTRPTYLADVLERATPAGRTWVAGGVYRLVRRDFRWGDAPTLRLEPTPGIDVPPTMRVYALERSLSREERLAEAQAGASDLVGRDAEKADLHAAFHESVSGGGWGAGQLVCRAVIGEMGIGKTALVATFLAELAPNARLLHVECTPVTMEVPYARVAELVRGAIGTTGKEPFDEVVALIARAGGGAAGGRSVEPDGRAPRRARDQPASGGGDEDAHARKKNILAGLRNLLAAIALAQPARPRRRGDALGRQGEPRRDRRDRARSRARCPILVLLVTRPDDRVLNVLEGVDAHRAARAHARRAGAPRRDAPRRARRRPRRCAPISCRRSAATPSSCSRWSTRSSSAGRSRSARPRPRAASRIARPRAHRARGDAGFGTLPSTLEQLLGDRIRELPAEEHAVVDWLAIAGGPLPLADVVKLAPRGRRRGHRPALRAGPLRPQGRARRLPPPAHARRRLRGARPGGPRADAPRARRAPRGDVARARSLGRHRRAAPRARARATTARPTSTSRRPTPRATATRRRSRSGTTSARSSLLGPEDMPAHRRARGARERLPDARTASRAPVSTSRRCAGMVRARGHAARRLPRPPAERALRLRRGPPRARRRRGPPGRRGRARVEDLARSRSRPRRSSSDFLRELGDVQGALAACDRALAAFDPGRRAATSRRGSTARCSARAASSCAASGACARRSTRTSTRSPSSASAARAGWRRASKNALAYAMFVQGRYEDGIALALESIQIDLSIGGRFQIAKTLTNVGPRLLPPRRRAARARLPDARARGARALRRPGRLGGDAARQRPHRDRARRRSTPPRASWRDASALNAVTGNAYDRTHESVVRAQLARARRQPNEAVRPRARSRATAPRTWRSSPFTSSRWPSRRPRASTSARCTRRRCSRRPRSARSRTCRDASMGSRSARSAPTRSSAPARRRRPSAHQRAADYANALMRTVRDPRLRKLFPKRPANAALFETTPVPLTAWAAEERQASAAAPAGHAPRPRIRMTSAFEERRQDAASR